MVRAVSYSREGAKILSLAFADIKVGDRAELRHTLTQDDIDAFARLTGDYNPLHVDAEFARKTMFRKPVVHGMVSASFFSTIIGTLLPGSGALWTSQTLEFLLPAFVGDELTISGVVEQKSAATRVLVLKTTVVNQHGHQVVTGRSSVKVLEANETERTVATEQRVAPEQRVSTEHRASNGQPHVALVTGASRGIGAAVAHRLASQGHRVAVNCTSSVQEAQALVAELNGKGFKAMLAQADVAVEREVAAMVEAIQTELGPIDEVIHCAAPPPIPTPFDQLTWSTVQKHLDVQLHGAFNCAKAILPGMVERKTGSLIFIGSIFTDGVPPTQQAAYIATKAALSSLARSLAVEYGPNGIRVNVVSPGMTQTDMISKLPEKTKLLAKMQTPLRRLAEADEIASVVEFLLGPGARHMTGETLRVCGGIAMV